MTSFERSVAFWLRAYPRRWRAVRSAEISAVLTDLAEPGAARLGASAAFGLVRGGWVTRWRGRPPLHVYLAYRLFNRPIPVRWRDWARDDIEGSLFGVRAGLGGGWVVWGINAFVNPAWVTLTAVLLLVVAGIGWRRSMRADQTRRHLALRAGERVVPGALVEGLVRRRRLEARSTLRAAEVALALAVIVGVAAAWGRPPLLAAVPCGADAPAVGCVALQPAALGPVQPLVLAATVLAAIVGLMLVPLVRSRLRRLIDLRPSQPNRDLVVTSSGEVAVRVVAVVVLVVTTLGLFGSRWFVLSASDVITGVLGPLAVLALPGVVAAGRVLRGSSAGAEGVSASDVRTIVLRGRPPRVDATRPGLVRVDEVLAPARPAIVIGPSMSPGRSQPQLGPP